MILGECWLFGILAFGYGFEMSERCIFLISWRRDKLLDDMLELCFKISDLSFSELGLGLEFWNLGVKMDLLGG